MITLLVTLVPLAASADRRAARGWNNPQALDLAKEAIAAKRAGNLPLCVRKDQASLAFEDHPYVKLHLASCVAALGRLRDALSAARDALAAGIREDDPDLTRAAQARVADLLAKLAHVRLKLPKNAQGIKIVINGTPLRSHLFGERLTMDPGDYVVEAEREDRGETTTFREKGTLAEGEEKTVEILLKPNNLPLGQEECLKNAATYEEKLACIEEKSTKPNVHVELDTSGYTDSTATSVLTPAINAAVVSPTAGWNLGGSYLVDVVSSASPDIVSMASPPFKETRQAGSLTGGYKIDTVALSGFGNVSREPDYLSITGGASSTIELDDKLVTPRIGYSLQHDTIGFKNTPFSHYERIFVTHTIEGGVTLVLSPTTVLVTGATVGIERGEQSKLYRFVPMFPADIASQVRPGEPIDSVNAVRLNIRPREQLPHERNRIAVGARINHRFANATLRVEERLYVDSWGVKATTTDTRYLVDLGERIRVWPHLRLHAQTGATFYERAYVAAFAQPDGLLVVPKYRTGDRELSTMAAVTAGGGARVALNGESSSVRYALLATADMMYNYYFDALFITKRTAVYGTIGFEVEF